MIINPAKDASNESPCFLNHCKRSDTFMRSKVEIGYGFGSKSDDCKQETLNRILLTIADAKLIRMYKI